MIISTLKSSNIEHLKDFLALITISLTNTTIYKTFLL